MDVGIHQVLQTSDMSNQNGIISLPIDVTEPKYNKQKECSSSITWLKRQLYASLCLEVAPKHATADLTAAINYRPRVILYSTCTKEISAILVIEAKTYLHISMFHTLI